MDQALPTLTSLARALTGRLSFEETLQTVVEHAARIRGAPRTSLRLFDASRTKLIAVTRAGEPLHEDPDHAFALGEGLMGWIARECAPLRTGDAMHDPRFAVRPDLKTELGSFLGVPLMTGAVCTGVLAAVAPERDHFTDAHERLAELIAAIAAPWVEVARLSRLSTVDPLTGALNRRGLDELFPEVAGDLVEPLSVIVLDLDRFKDVNDAHGHAAGDEVLRAVTDRAAEVVRAGDAVVRYGGEEFLLVLSGAGLRQAERIAERARIALRSAPVRIADAALTITASLGVAERRPRETRTELIARADQALYRAKAAGRDRVEIDR